MTFPNSMNPLSSRFVYICHPRGNGRGGGLAIIHREKWKVMLMSALPAVSFECLVFRLPGPFTTIVAALYRPPKPHCKFLPKFSSLLVHLHYKGNSLQISLLLQSHHLQRRKHQIPLQSAHENKRIIPVQIIVQPKTHTHKIIHTVV